MLPSAMLISSGENPLPNPNPNPNPSPNPNLSAEGALGVRAARVGRLGHERPVEPHLRRVRGAGAQRQREAAPW